MENISITAACAYGLGRPPYRANHGNPAALGGVPITLTNSRAKGRLRLPAHSWLLGKATGTRAPPAACPMQRGESGSGSRYNQQSR